MSEDRLPTEKDEAVLVLEQMHGLIAATVLQHMATTLNDGEMSLSQVIAIAHLHRDGPKSIAELAAGTGLSHAAASRMVERLVQGGLVERRELPEDRRQKQVKLTPSGRHRLMALQAMTAVTYAQLLAAVPEPILARAKTALASLKPYLPTHPLHAAIDDQPSDVLNTLIG